MMKKTSRRPASKTKRSVSKPDLTEAVDLDEPLALKPVQHVYLYHRFVQLYLLSRHARWSFAFLVLMHKPYTSKDSEISRQAIAEAELLDDETEPQQSWLHKPLPYSGYIRVLVVFAGLGIASIFVQIIYPSGVTLPLSRLEGNGYAGFKTHTQIEQKIAYINGRTITVQTRDSSVSATPSAMGVKANADQSFERLSDYPIEQRFIPFSILFRSLRAEPVARDINVDKLTSFSKNIITVTEHQPKNAQVTLQGTKLVISPSEDGYSYDQASIQRQIATNSLSNKPLELKPALKPPQISTADAEDSIYGMQRRIDASLTISAADQTIRITPDMIASWVVINQKPDIKTISLAFDRAKVAQTLKPLVAGVDQTGTPDQVTTLNGVEAGRTYGKSGRVLQFDDLVNQVSSASDWTVGLIQAKVAQQPAQQVYIRKYSRDSQGLQSLLDYWTKNNKGRYGIEVRSQNGRMQAFTNVYQLFSGTYKLYLPHLAYGQFTTRKLNPGYTTSTGYTIDGCIDRIVIANNDNCSLAVGDLIGWGDNNSLLMTEGLTSTTISRGNGVTTAHDGAEWASKLISGALTTYAQRSDLTNLMSQQTLRSGVPAGVAGISVADRAGQSGSVRYDVAIVYHPRGTYIISMFTDGSSFAAIADLASQVNQVMNQ